MDLSHLVSGLEVTGRHYILWQGILRTLNEQPPFSITVYIISLLSAVDIENAHSYHFHTLPKAENQQILSITTILVPILKLIYSNIYMHKTVLFLPPDTLKILDCGMRKIKIRV